MILQCRYKRCGKPFNTEGLEQITDRKGKYVICPNCGWDNNIPIRHKLIQMRVREDIYEQIRARARQYGFTHITPFIRTAAVSFVPGQKEEQPIEEKVQFGVFVGDPQPEKEAE